MYSNIKVNGYVALQHIWINSAEWFDENIAEIMADILMQVWLKHVW